MATKALIRSGEVFPTVFNDFFRPWNEWFENGGNLLGKPISVPAVNVTENTKDFKLSLAAPGLKKDDFIAVVDGMEMDIVRDIHAPDWEVLDLYCDRAASAVGRLSVPIFGIDGDLGIDLAHHLGRALQLTNILRDIDEDAALGRLYLPKEGLHDAGITETDIDAILAHPALDRVCRSIAQKTRNYYRRSEAIMARCPRRSARSPRMMATVYRGVLEKLITRGWHAPRADVRRSKRYVLWAVLRDGIF